MKPAGRSELCRRGCMLRIRKAARNPRGKGSGSLDDLSRTALKAFLIARDAAFNVRDLLTHSSRMAFLAIKECEQELDIIERYIDERLPAAITRVNEARARQLLTSLKCTTDLERIGDLMMSVAMRVQSRTSEDGGFRRAPAGGDVGDPARDA